MKRCKTCGKTIWFFEDYAFREWGDSDMNHGIRYYHIRCKPNNKPTNEELREWVKQAQDK